MRPESSGHGKLPTPSPDSPFYMPPPSSKALRWSIVLSLVGPFLLAFSAFEFALAHQWAGLVFALVMLSAYILLVWIRIRAILRALARRRTGESNSRNGARPPTGPTEPTEPTMMLPRPRVDGKTPGRECATTSFPSSVSRRH